MSAHAAHTDDDDPVVQEYDVFITPEQAQPIHLLQYMNRPPDLPFTGSSRPSQLRAKLQSGFVEVDVPIDIGHNYNRLQGVKWGESMRKTKGYGQKAWGIASGFERVNVPRLPNQAASTATGAQSTPIMDEDEIEEYVNNFQVANEKGHVLNTQTFGGKLINAEEGEANYMVGAFKGKNLYLTTLSGMVQLRTQFNHLDATAQLDALARRREKEAQDGTKPAEPRAVLPTVKKTVDTTPAAKTKAFLHSAHEEKWTKVQFFDETMDESYAAYDDRLVVDMSEAPSKLHAATKHAHFLDSGSSHGGKRRPLSKHQHQHQQVDISDVSDDDADEVQSPKKQRDGDGDRRMEG
ncbi:uncharacterized protein BDR25DRAFT_217298 [Lindgomyces ingoldianus]|uniref:Uncharacterized protein n=1 Tax=Lindgomyces ingoldianus TaxID=673940 RepID=A0ACB6R4G5_9PLEO|nr:uncharacterized protein BDR25DRAFT_217298 [Lindgomyces ingoldianus]KAF2473957.1 hypothetical protein BDR25DRAFT_217298 [Lindgomyces ingoldianus]